MMVSFLAGPCDICHEVDALATPEQAKAAGFAEGLAVCVVCVERAQPQVTITIASGEEFERAARDAVPAKGPLVLRGRKLH